MLYLYALFSASSISHGKRCENSFRLHVLRVAGYHAPSYLPFISSLTMASAGKFINFTYQEMCRQVDAFGDNRATKEDETSSRERNDLFATHLTVHTFDEMFRPCKKDEIYCFTFN